MRTIGFKTSYEDIITRIIGLFAYIDFDKDGNMSLHEATDSPMGCYGKIVENIQIPKDKLIDFKVNRNSIVKSGNTYSFKTLISLYYQYLNDTEEDIDGFEKFKEFIEKGIGKVEVNITKTKETDLVPEYIYLAHAERLYNEMYNLKVVCDLYETHIEKKTELDKESEIDMCCKCERFHRRGGDRMLDFLKEKMAECKKVAKEYFNYAQSRENNLTINYNINLFSSDRDFGIVTPMKTIGNVNKTIVKNDKTGKDYFEESFYTNSKLKSLRKRQKYINAVEEEETPDLTEDWLYFYRVGYVSNISVLNDEMGNILTVNTDINNVKENEEITDLYAYGDLITKIELSEATKKYYETGKLPDTNDEIELDFNKMLNAFKIIYYTDVHLTAECSGVDYDDDGNKLIYFDNFKPDYWYQSIHGDDSGVEVNYHGIEYEEIYHFDEDSEIVDLIRNGQFENYVEGKYDVDYISDENSDNNEKDLKLFEKYAFSVYNNMKVYNKQLTQTTVSYNDISSEAKIRITQYIDKNENKETSNIKTNDGAEIIIYPNSISRHEFYEGISYTPTEDLNVYIDRGTTSIFDKHIRLGEIKTLQDMEEFTNGSFFKLQE